jgi:deoxyribonuclease V
LKAAPPPSARSSHDVGDALKRRIEAQTRRALDPAEEAFFSDLQRILARRERVLPKSITRICGVDAAYYGDRVFAAARVFERGRLVAEASCEGTCSIPYVSGLFYLREGPFAVAAVRSLDPLPQLVCFDAHGAAHPRSAGLATVCGMVLRIPSVGIAKSLLVGEESPGDGLGRIVLGRRTVGFVTTVAGAKRYWSAGYSVTLASLRSVIRRQGPACILAVGEADRAARQARSSYIRGNGSVPSSIEGGV